MDSRDVVSILDEVERIQREAHEAMCIPYDLLAGSGPDCATVAPHLDYEGAAERARIRRELDRLNEQREATLACPPVFAGMDLAHERDYSAHVARQTDDQGKPIIILAPYPEGGDLSTLDYRAMDRADRADCGLEDLPLPPEEFNKRARRYLLTRRLRKRVGFDGCAG